MKIIKHKEEAKEALLKLHRVGSPVEGLLETLRKAGVTIQELRDKEIYEEWKTEEFAEKVGWVAADDGQLAYDRDGNGIIDNITELFGDDEMPAFEKLARFDTNHNGEIDQGDEKYEQLLVWRDLNQDGRTDSGELKTLRETGIKEISLAETPDNTYQKDNYISGTSKFTWFDNSTSTIALLGICDVAITILFNYLYGA